MLLQGSTVDPKRMLNISSFLTFPHLSHLYHVECHVPCTGITDDGGMRKLGRVVELHYGFLGDCWMGIIL